MIKAVGEINNIMSQKRPRMRWVTLKRMVSEGYSEEMDFSLVLEGQNEPILSKAVFHPVKNFGVFEGGRKKR